MARGELDGQGGLGFELYLEPRMVTRLGRILPHNSQAPPQAIELFTAHEVGNEDWTGFQV